MLRASFLIAFALLIQRSIVTRHDVPDQKFVEFADSLAVTAAVIKYNATDLAGTLIAPNWVLSAAHVAETLEPGDRLLTVQGDSVVVKSVAIHPGWLENGRPEDIALIELADTVSGLPVVAVYAGSDEVGRIVVIIGNGDHGTGLTGPNAHDGRMRAATNRVDSATDDYLVWGFEKPGSEPGAVTRLEGISGPGDSGGPALLYVAGEYRIVGISSGQSTSATNGLEGRYGVTEYYTRVSTYADWIAQTISD